MHTSRLIAALVTLATAVAGPQAHAGERYSFPSPNGLQVSAAPAPSFAAPPIDTGSFVYGAFHRHDMPPPLPAPLPQYSGASPLESLSHALTGAAYANYTADYARIFAPAYAVTSWTGRVFGVFEQGHGAVDAWTGAAYGLNRVRGPRGVSPPDLTLMPQLRRHPELEQAPAYVRE